MLDSSPEPMGLAAAQLPPGNTSPGSPAYALGPYAEPLFPADTNAVFGRLLKILRKQCWILISFMVIAMMFALSLQFAFPRLYSATALLRLDRHSAPGAVGQEASQTSSIDDMDVIIDTDMEVAQSDPVIRPVAEQYNLVDYGKQPGIWARWFGKDADPEAMRRAKAAPIELPGLKVTRPANTYLIRITYRAWKNPQLAADVANGIAQSLVRQLHESLDHSYTDLTRAMRDDMEQLRLKMQESSKKMTRYEKELNMVDPEQRSTVLTSRLSELLAEYTAAQADRINKQATFEGISKSSTLAASRSTETDHQRQSLLDEALQHLSTARQQFAAARAYYGENHPEYRKAKQQLDEAQAQVETMRVATNEKAEADYRQALRRESLLKGQFEQAKGEVDALKGRALEYSQLKTEAENDRRVYMDLEVRMREADVNRQFRDATIQFAAPALAPADAIFPKLMVNLPIAFVLALVTGILTAIAVDALDTTFSDADDVLSRIRLEVMGTLPDVWRLREKEGNSMSASLSLYSSSTEMGAHYEEAIRMLRSAIGRAGMNQQLRTLLITSSSAAEGKSTTAAHLAEACALGGKKVLLIDADLRHPPQHKIFEDDIKIGLADVLAHGISPVDVIVEVGVPGLFVMPAGPALMNPSDLIGLGFAGVLSDVKGNFDLVIIDAPPVLGPSETQEIATMVDGVLVMAKAEVTSGKDLAETLIALNRGRANVLGVVMNQVKGSKAKRFEGYSEQQRDSGESVNPA